MTQPTDMMSASYPVGMRLVGLDSVEKELDNLWRDANMAVASAAGHAIARNSVLTLVVFTHRRADANQLLNALHALTGVHPSRSIFISADPRYQGELLEASIATRVSDDTASYGEDILIEAQAGAVRHLPGAVLPLIVSGLPAFLWWTGEPPWGSELFEALVDGSDRLIVDTSEMSHVETSLSALQDLQHRKGGRCAVSDTSWTAQGPWREILAQFFDSAEVRPYLDGIERVTIEYAAGDEDAPANASQAYLYAGWLASRLGWRAQHALFTGVDASRQHTLRDASGRLISLEITARFGIPQQMWWSPQVGGETLNAGERAERDAAGNPWVRTGALMSIYLASRLNGDRASFTVAREQDLAHVTTACQVPNVAMPSQTIHLASISPLHPLAEQLQMLGRDAVYEDALTVAAAMLAGHNRR
jgi:glucose-6-phosphate dehydrogenase assembly protein OpcA